MKLWPQAQSIRLKLGCRPGYLGHSAAPVYGSAIRMIDNVTLEPIVPPEGTPVEGVIPARLNVALGRAQVRGGRGSYEVKVVLHVPNKDPHTFPTYTITLDPRPHGGANAVFQINLGLDLAVPLSAGGDRTA